MRRNLILPMLPLLAGLASCGDKAADDAGSERRTAAGEVLGGEVSDAMLPLDTVRSTSPTAPRAAASGSAAPEQSPADVPFPPPKIVNGATPLPAPSETLPAGPEPQRERPGE